MVDGYRFGFDTIVFPATSPATLASLDPITQTILRYYTNILQINLGNAFATDAVACGLTHQRLDYMVDGYLVGQAVAYPIDTVLKTTDFKFPLLSVYRTDRKFVQHSTMKLIIQSNYVVNYILPPLSTEQYSRLYKYFSAISDVLVQRTWQGYDQNYNNGEQIWKTANLAYAFLDVYQYGSFLVNDGKTEFPSLRLNLTFMEESQFVPDNYESLSDVYVEVDEIDGYNSSLPVYNIADGYCEPNLSITSISMSSGPVTGNTLVIIQGTGFTNITTSNTLTESLTFNGAQAAQLLVKSNTAIVAITGPGAIAGTGDVVITDDLGNTFTLGGSWTYY